MVFICILQYTTRSFVHSFICIAIYLFIRSCIHIVCRSAAAAALSFFFPFIPMLCSFHFAMFVPLNCFHTFAHLIGRLRLISFATQLMLSSAIFKNDFCSYCIREIEFTSLSFFVCPDFYCCILLLVSSHVQCIMRGFRSLCSVSFRCLFVAIVIVVVVERYTSKKSMRHISHPRLSK